MSAGGSHHHHHYHDEDEDDEYDMGGVESAQDDLQAFIRGNMTNTELERTLLRLLHQPADEQMEEWLAASHAFANPTVDPNREVSPTKLTTPPFREPQDDTTARSNSGMMGVSAGSASFSRSEAPRPPADVSAIEDILQPHVATMRERSNLSAMSNRFVSTFLVKGGSLGDLCENLRQDDEVLTGMRRNLEAFRETLQPTREKLKELSQQVEATTLMLENTEKVLAGTSGVVDALTVPLDVVHLILQTHVEGCEIPVAVNGGVGASVSGGGGIGGSAGGSGRPELGPQFFHAVARLEEVMMKLRRGHVVVSTTSAFQPTAAQSEPPSGSPTTSHGRTLSTAATMTSKTPEPEAPRVVVTEEQIPFAPLVATPNAVAVVTSLAAIASMKIKTFLLMKLDASIGKPRTNVQVQQLNVLLPLRPLVRFLRSAAETFLSVAELKCFEAVRSKYVTIMQRVYKDGTRGYLVKCNELETMWWQSGDKTAPGGTSASPHVAAPAAPASSGGLFGWLGATVLTAAVTVDRSVQPLLGDMETNCSPSMFALGTRGALLEDLQAPLMVPHANKARKLSHCYEETFRSVNLLLSDAVTSEFLFSIDLFDGDVSVYVDCFRSTIQLIVDYVAEVILQVQTPTTSSNAGSSSGGAGGGASPGQPAPSHAQAHSHFPECRTANVHADFRGTLMLIRIVHGFQELMDNRKLLSCLNGYYQSLLLLLWPSFKGAFDIQLQSLRKVDPISMYRWLGKAPMTPPPTTTNQGGAGGIPAVCWRLGQVHPLTSRFAEFAFTLLHLCGVLGDGTNRAFQGGGGKKGLLNGKNGGDSMAGRGGGLPILNIPDYQEEDYSDSDHRYAALEGNLAFLRLEFEKALKGLAEGAQQAENSAAAASRLPVPLNKLISTIITLNNVSFVLNRWSQEALKYCGWDSDGKGQWNSPHRSDRQDDEDGGDGLNGSQDGQGEGTTAGKPIWRVATSLGSEEGGLLAKSPDAVALLRSLIKARGTLVDTVLNSSFPLLTDAVRRGEQRMSSQAGLNSTNAAAPSITDAELEAAGKWMVASCRTALEATRAAIAGAVPWDQVEAADILRQTMLQVQLYNTRFVVLMGKLFSQNPNLRTMLVSRQQLDAILSRVGK